ncbi:MAG TPA: branched-chain amino acid ABC transporter permease, partial [Firmicutes bacterium]|nr:branched-chain amino acid ABC transporter permease [Bacillota bacterium]
GSLFASFQGYISPEIFVTTYSFGFVSMLVVGGLGSVPGAVLGAVILTFLMEALRFLKEWYMIVYATCILLTIIYSPRGLIGIVETLYERLRIQLGKSVPGISRP